MRLGVGIPRGGQRGDEALGDGGSVADIRYPGGSDLRPRVLGGLACPGEQGQQVRAGLRRGGRGLHLPGRLAVERGDAVPPRRQCLADAGHPGTVRYPGRTAAASQQGRGELGVTLRIGVDRRNRTLQNPVEPNHGDEWKDATDLQTALAGFLAEK